MKDRKFILYIVIIVFIASLGTLTYRVGSSIKAKKDAIIEEYNKEKQEIKDKQKKAEEEAKKRQEELEQKRKEEELEREKDSFNNMHEFYAGTQGGTATGLEVDETHLPLLVQVGGRRGRRGGAARFLGPGVGRGLAQQHGLFAAQHGARVASEG